jgi:broad specificity phosphatase PhoE
MSSEPTWENQDWIQRAREIVAWMETIRQNQPLMFLVRHSHRETLQDHDEMVSGGLTELGKKMAVELGKRIPRVRKMHIYTSFVPRCFETAEAIAEGYTQHGGEVVDIDALPSLVGPQILDREVWKNLNPNGDNITDFVNTWADGHFGERMEPFADYMNRLMDDTIERLLSVDDGIIHVHVTHDLALMSAKRKLFKRALSAHDREPYLGGIGLTFSDSQKILFAQGEEMLLTTE